MRGTLTGADEQPAGRSDAGIIHLAGHGAEQGPITPTDAETIHKAWKLAQSRFRKKDALMAAVERLVDHGYLIPQQTNHATGGRPASPHYKVRL